MVSQESSGAAPRSKSKSKSKLKPKSKSKSKPKSKPSRSSKSAPRAKPSPKSSKRAERVPGAPRVAAEPAPSPSTPGRSTKPAQPPPAPRPAGAQGTLLGEVLAPSGKLAIFDVGLVGYLPRPALEPAIVKAAVPPDRPLPVIGVPVGKGRFAECWDHVAVILGAGEVASSRKLGEAGVDFARLICIDHAALAHWVHEDSLDGRADFVFWGRDEAQLAKAMRAPRVKEGHGWVDLPLAEAEARSDEAARRKADNRWHLATDLRPHSHHFHALAAARASPHGAGTLELAGTRLVLFFTSWGDGVFPIYLDLDADERPVRVRIQLATSDSNAALARVNP